MCVRRETGELGSPGLGTQGRIGNPDGPFRHPMTRHRTLIRLSAALAGVALVWACGGDSPTVPPTPEPARPATVTVSPATADLTALGATVQLTAEVRDQNARVMAGATVTWSSGDTSVATVDASGLVTGVAEGAATITASAGSASGSAVVTVAQVENPDRAALVALYNATDGPNWVNSDNWLTDAPLGDWYGVDTDTSGRVVRLDLDGRWDSDAREYIPHGLSGPIPPELGNLTDLTRLDLAHNFLSGPVPTELGRLTDLESLNLGYNDLTGPIPAELGSLTDLESLHLGGNDLTGPIPAEFGKLGSLTWLWLFGNSLTGPIPAELGSLADLESLNLYGNDLTGPIPESFLEIESLKYFGFQRNADLCAPGTIDFVTWLEGIEDTSGPYCNESDVVVLNLLYETSGGPGWTNSTGWLETPALDEWYGVTADALGRVATLDLSRNGLAGQLPGNLSELAHMTELRIAHNTDLSGRLPLSLADLSLGALHYAGTELCAPADASFQAWLDDIASHDGTAAECPPLSDREILEVFHDAAGGQGWANSDNWRTDQPLGTWHGVDTDGEGRVISLELWHNGISGPIPWELGGLERLEALALHDGRLTGPIPAALGNLANLKMLELSQTDLEGPIPPELGGLGNLTELRLWGNELEGSIPTELGDLANLEALYLGGNDLTGPIPTELGDLANLRQLGLQENELTGPVPPELGSLASLEYFDGTHNDLSGPVPPELGDLANLEALYLGGNDLTGPIPTELGDLANLRQLGLQENELTGPVPPELGSLASLEYFDGTHNDLT